MVLSGGNVIGGISITLLTAVSTFLAMMAICRCRGVQKKHSMLDEKYGVDDTVEVIGKPDIGGICFNICKF